MTVNRTIPISVAASFVENLRRFTFPNKQRGCESPQFWIPHGYYHAIPSQRVWSGVGVAQMILEALLLIT